MALLIKSNGESKIVLPANGSAFSLEELQQYVGGYIEIWQLPHVVMYSVASNSMADLGARSMVLNEEGKLMQLPINTEATNIASGVIPPGDFVVGDVLLCTQEEIGE